MTWNQSKDTPGFNFELDEDETGILTEQSGECQPMLCLFRSINMYEKYFELKPVRHIFLFLELINIRSAWQEKMISMYYVRVNIVI